MIINIGQRTDIPAFYSDWFYNRIKQGYVYVRNPYYPSKVTKYILKPDIVDCLCFCTKNPAPMLDRLNEIDNYRQFWFITITPYLKDIEPYVPHFNEVIESFKRLSNKVGKTCIGWRYDPIFINDRYTVDYHFKVFECMAKELSGYTERCVISFIDLYEKTKNNFPDVKEVSRDVQTAIVKEFVRIARKYNVKIYTCLENKEFEIYGVNCKGCMSKEVIEEAVGIQLDIKTSKVRKGCDCLLGNDIGAYNTCLHGCLYCYANTDKKTVHNIFKKHDPTSPMLIGNLNEKDILIEAKQKSYINYQLFFDL